MADFLECFPKRSQVSWRSPLFEDRRACQAHRKLRSNGFALIKSSLASGAERVRSTRVSAPLLIYRAAYI